MSMLPTLILSGLLTLAPEAAASAAPGAPQPIIVDCSVRGALQRALGKAEPLGPVDLTLDGVCEGYFRISGGIVTLRGLTAESGLAPPAGDPLGAPVLEIVDADVSLRGMIVRGGQLGVYVHGPRAELLLFEVDVHEQDGLGVWGDDGARVRPIESVLRGGEIALLIDGGSSANLQRDTVSGRRVGVLIGGRSSAAINDTVIEGCGDTGLYVQGRSDVNVLGGRFSDNGSSHVGAGDYSTLTLLSGVELGSADDTTTFSMGATRDASIASYSTPRIFGDVSAIIGSSIRLGNAVIEGNVFSSQFSDVHLRSAEISGAVVCRDGADAYCRQTTTAGALDCPSMTCGDQPPASASTTARPAPEPPSVERVLRVRSAR